MSSPLPWIRNLARKSVLDLTPYSSARSLKEKGLHEIYLDANEFPLSDTGWNRYPDPQPKKLKEKLAVLWGCKEDEILLGRGSDEAIDCLSRTFLRDGIDSILICPPTYGVYEVSARIQGAEVIEVPLLPEKDFSPDFPKIISALEANPNLKIVYLCSPNNPTGLPVPAKMILDLSKKIEGRAILVVDEAYQEFAEEGGVLGEIGKSLEAYPSLVILRTLSKAYGLAGLRIGAAIAHPGLISLLKKVLAPYPLSASSAQEALQVLSELGKDEMSSRITMIRAERKRISSALKELPFIEKVYPSQANFILFKTSKHEEILKNMKENQIVVRDRSRDLGLSGCIRVTVGSPEENTCFLEALRGVAHG